MLVQSADRGPITLVELAQAVAALEEPPTRKALGEESNEVGFFMALAADHEAPVIELLASRLRIYSLALEKLPTQTRSTVCQRVAEYIFEGHGTSDSLAPILMRETELVILSTASLNMAMLREREHDDPLSGPKFLLSMLRCNLIGLRQRLGILMGLTLLEDERLLPLIRGLWRDFSSSEDRRCLASAKSGAVSTLQIEFFLDWLENTDDESDIGAIAGALAALPAHSRDSRVRVVRRTFPASAVRDGAPVEVLKSWTFAEYAKVIRPRLEPLIERESLPKVIPAVLEFWHSAG